ncbi:HAD family hydrolase [Sulfobacillus harzensis]|uniref:HAD family hydrolase n=1 Tax=Sulfobacillus harzensis TaxID=2729629 RepID=A0A7Y0L3U3_9FIRM|nr:HAD family hydrolase [Sulfobacillus harzensis]
MLQRYKRPLLIWDIDGTLLEPLGVGRQALNQAFHALYGISGGFDGLDFAGATDHHLWLQAADSARIPPEEASNFFAVYVRHLRQQLSRTPLQPLAGVASLIADLSMRGWPLRLGTGNIRLGAYAKLNAAGLAPYFPGGGFSEAGSTRADILQRAADSHLDRPVIVIGDTPRDVDAAHTAGFFCFGIATGRFDVAALQAAAADAVLESLAEPTPFFDQVWQFGQEKARE